MKKFSFYFIKNLNKENFLLTFKKEKMIIIIFLIISCFIPLNGQFRKYANEFLEIGVGARNLAMGKSGICNANGVWGIYWNPSIISNFHGEVDIAYMHSIYAGGIVSYDFGGITKKVDTTNAIGISFLRVAVDNIPNTLEMVDPVGGLHFDKIKYFSISDNALLVSYGSKGLIPWGFTGKFIYRKGGKWAKAFGFGADISLTGNLSDIVFAIILRNIIPTGVLWTYTLDDTIKSVFLQTNNEIPQKSWEFSAPSLRIAMSKNFNLHKKITLLLEGTLTAFTDGMRNAFITSKGISVDVTGGFEISYAQIVFLRGGFYNIQKEKSIFKTYEKYTLTIGGGIGISLGRLSIDYAYLDLGNLASDFPYSHVFSASYKIIPQ